MKKKFKNECYLDVEPYHRKVYLFHGTKEELAKRINEVFECPANSYEDIIKEAAGAVFTLINEKKGVNCIVLWTSLKSYDNISHEVFHLTDKVMGDAGCKLTNESEEAYAYLNGWLN